MHRPTPGIGFIRSAMVFLILAMASHAWAQQYFRIGTGGTAGSYYPIGTLIAKAVSVPGQRIVTAQTSNGSLGNVIGVASGSLESGFSQSDVTTWAYSGKGIFQDKPALTGLRLIANLYPEHVQIVVRKDSPIQSVADLRGKRVALDEIGSGTLISARLVLEAYGLHESDLKPDYTKPNLSGDKLLNGTIDAFFFTGGAPSPGIAALANGKPGIRLLSIEPAAAERIRKASPFFFNDTIPPNTYAGVEQTRTLAVGAQWVTHEKANADLVYDITKALYSAEGQKILSEGHAKGPLINLRQAVQGAAIPIHPGAKRYYKEAGILN